MKEQQRVETSDGVIVGTPGFIAPEQLIAAGWTVDRLKKWDRLTGSMEGWGDTSDPEDLESKDLSSWGSSWLSKISSKLKAFLNPTKKGD